MSCNLKLLRYYIYHYNVFSKLVTFYHFTSTFYSQLFPRVVFFSFFYFTAKQPFKAKPTSIPLNNLKFFLLFSQLANLSLTLSSLSSCGRSSIKHGDFRELPNMPNMPNSQTWPMVFSQFSAK